MTKIDEAFDEWRGVPFGPDSPVATLLSERELALCKQAFVGGVHAALYVVASNENNHDLSDAIRRELLGEVP